MKSLTLGCLLFLFFAPLSLLAQPKVNVDSLTAALNAYPKEDTAKVRMLVTLAQGSQVKNPQKATEYFDTAISLSEQLGNDFWIGKSYGGKATFLSKNADFEASKAAWQKSIAVLSKSNAYPNEVGVGYVGLGVVAGKTGDFTHGLEYYTAALTAFEKAKNETKQAQAIMGIGSIYRSMENYEKALEYYTKVMNMKEVMKDKKTVLSLYANLAALYNNIQKYTTSLEYAQKALDIAVELGDIFNIGRQYDTIANIYFFLGDKKTALTYMKKSLEEFRKINDKFEIARLMRNMANCMEDHTEAIETLKKAAEYSESVNNIASLAHVYQSIAEHYTLLHDYRQAYVYAQKGLKTVSKATDNITTLLLHHQLIEALANGTPEDLQSWGIAESDWYGLAKSYSDKIFEAAATSKLNPRYEMLAWYSLASVEEKQQNHLAAYKAYLRFVTIKDSLAGEDVKKQITRKEIQYEYDKKETALKHEQQLTAAQLEKQTLLTVQQQQALQLKEQALTLSNREKELAHLAYLKEQAEKQEKAQELTLSQEREKGKDRDLRLTNLALSAQQKQNLYLGAFISMLLIGLAVLGYFYRTLQRQKNIISQQNEINEQFISILSHDIKEPLLGVSLLLRRLRSTDPQMQEASQSLEQQVKTVNALLGNLMKIKKAGIGSKDDRHETASVRKVVQAVIDESFLAIQAKNLRIDVAEISEKYTLPVREEKLHIILYNLLSNAIKYSYADGVIEISVEPDGIAIRDFGVGIPADRREQLLRTAVRPEKGTHQEIGNGVGLLLLGQLVQHSAIKIILEAPAGSGTLAKVALA